MLSALHQTLFYIRTLSLEEKSGVGKERRQTELRREVLTLVPRELALQQPLTQVGQQKGQA